MRYLHWLAVPVVLLGAFSVHAQDLTETYTTADGLSFRHPASVTVAESTGTTLSLYDMDSDSVLGTTLVPTASLETLLDADEVLAALSQSYGLPVEDFTLGSVMPLPNGTWVFAEVVDDNQAFGFLLLSDGFLLGINGDMPLAAPDLAAAILGTFAFDAPLADGATEAVTEVAITVDEFNTLRDPRLSQVNTMFDDLRFQTPSSVTLGFTMNNDIVLYDNEAGPRGELWPVIADDTTAASTADLTDPAALTEALAADFALDAETLTAEEPLSLPNGIFYAATGLGTDATADRTESDWHYGVLEVASGARVLVRSNRLGANDTQDGLWLAILSSIYAPAPATEVATETATEAAG